MPIKMTPEIYYEAFTLGNYNDFVDDTDNVRKAINVAVAANHLADCYFNFHKKNNPKKVNRFNSLTDFRKYIYRKTDFYFRDIYSIANAYKHLYTGLKENNAKYSTISSAGTIESIIFEDEEINQLSEEPKGENNYKMTVFYTRKTGEQIQFLKAIDCVIAFWETMLYD